ncbi:SusD/RagB family nutrient-binding outer membrane lipoprotein [Pedobacter caeni]|uniref:Starch-binding associating with outer membrane n=1 Tax=Pedobacter caeni TaxID=288992 RepID=A0A1M5JVL2_9SPHI|nr:SusD/RagB family nutrient-binding outer membrane lipoprotein [Pedobacter caeni]SHG44601.1 Starch-binding associating with outer membrane [Pedobacter caeni]
MKHIVKMVLCSFTVAMGLSSCTKDFERLNTPPTSVTTIDPSLVFSRVLKDGTFAEGGELPNNKLGSWTQHWAGGPVVPVSRYLESAEDAVWEQHYSLIKDLKQISLELKGKESDPSGRSKLAIARIYEISIWQRLTDLFGDVPYSQITKDPANVQVIAPFDTQESIYTSLIADLNSAIAQLNDNDESYGTADFFYKGSIPQWRKFGNSLKLRLGLRLRYANPALARSTVESAMANPALLLSGNADNAAVPTFNNAQPVNTNPMLRQFQTGSSDLRYLAAALIDKLKEYSDPRLPLLAQPTVNSVKAGKPDYAGLGVALTDAQLSQVIRDNYSTPSLSTWFSAAFAPIPTYALTYSEVSFFKAEAALLGWGASSGDAETFFKAGVTAAFQLAPYSINTIPPAYNTTVLSFTGLSDAQKLEKIMTQKWIHLFGRNYEAFAEWRRNGYPVLTPGSNPGSTGGKIPRRAIYSTREAQLNNANYQAAVGRLSNGDSFLSKVWWDKR